MALPRCSGPALAACCPGPALASFNAIETCFSCTPADQHWLHLLNGVLRDNGLGNPVGPPSRSTPAEAAAAAAAGAGGSDAGPRDEAAAAAGAEDTAAVGAAEEEEEGGDEEEAAEAAAGADEAEAVEAEAEEDEEAAEAPAGAEDAGAAAPAGAAGDAQQAERDAARWEAAPGSSFRAPHSLCTVDSNGEPSALDNARALLASGCKHGGALTACFNTPCWVPPRSVTSSFKPLPHPASTHLRPVFVLFIQCCSFNAVRSMLFIQCCSFVACCSFNAVHSKYGPRSPPPRAACRHSVLAAAGCRQQHGHALPV